MSSIFSLIMSKKLARYLMVGGTAFIVEYGSFLVFYKFLGVQVYVANSISFCLGLGVSFMLNRSWTFNSGNFKRRGHHQLALYASLALINLGLTNIIVGLLKQAGISPTIGKIMAMLSIVCWNFIIFKLIIFASHTNESRLD